VFLYHLNARIQPQIAALLQIGRGRQKKDHAVTLSLIPLLGCGGEWKEKGKNWWVGIRAV